MPLNIFNLALLESTAETLTIQVVQDFSYDFVSSASHSTSIEPKTIQDLAILSATKVFMYCSDSLRPVTRLR